jgi:hypothetical protein
MGLDRDDTNTMCTLLGHTLVATGETDAGAIIDNINDVAPYVGLGRVTKLMEDGVLKYRATVLSLIKFKEPSDEDNTQGESVEFATTSLSGSMKIPDSGQWRIRKTFTSQADAISWIETKLGGTPSNSTQH